MGLATFNSVPAQPFQQLILEQLERTPVGTTWRARTSPFHTLAQRSGLTADLLRKIAGGKRDTIAFSTADLLVTRLVGPAEWHTRPELAAVYDQAIPVEEAA